MTDLLSSSSVTCLDLSDIHGTVVQYFKRKWEPAAIKSYVPYVIISSLSCCAISKKPYLIQNPVSNLD